MPQTILRACCIFRKKEKREKPEKKEKKKRGA